MRSGALQPRLALEVAGAEVELEVRRGRPARRPARATLRRDQLGVDVQLEEAEVELLALVARGAAADVEREGDVGDLQREVGDGQRRAPARAAESRRRRAGPDRRSSGPAACASDADLGLSLSVAIAGAAQGRQRVSRRPKPSKFLLFPRPEGRRRAFPAPPLPVRESPRPGGRSMEDASLAPRAHAQRSPLSVPPG